MENMAEGSDVEAPELVTWEANVIVGWNLGIQCQRSNGGDQMGYIHGNISMKRIATTAAVIVILLMSAWACAQTNPEYSTVIVKYVAKSDRPFPAIVISTSMKEAEWYRDELYGGPASVFVDITIVRKTTMRKLTDIIQEKNVQSGFFPVEKPKTEPTLDLALGQGQKHSEIAINTKDSAVILARFKSCLASYPSLVEQLSKAEDRMNQYLKSRHD